jgi:hypothetical protein
VLPAEAAVHETRALHHLRFLALAFTGERGRYGLYFTPPMRLWNKLPVWAVNKCRRTLNAKKTLPKEGKNEEE